mmetsp:Transcript_14350/g.21388  ORF Transcript_14350/g.21388 Transcript_14350/m.21388 type:complete len:342 (-) Transcript_14350:46-1071(-)
MPDPCGMRRGPSQCSRLGSRMLSAWSRAPHGALRPFCSRPSEALCRAPARETSAWPPALCIQRTTAQQTPCKPAANAKKTLAPKRGRPAGRPRFGARVFFALAAGLQGVCWAVVLWMQRAGGQAEVSRAGALQSASEGLLQKGRKAPCGALDQADNIRDPSLEHCDGPRRMPHGSGMACALNASSFFLHAATYTLPSLLPFAASAYPGSDIEQQLLLWMLVFQQGGETLGRVMAPVSREWKLLPRLAAACAPVVFVFFLSSAVCPQMLAEAISVHLASKLLPVMCLGYYFSYGVLQTFMFIQAHSFVDDKAVAERIASNMGFLGQLGSLVANILTFTVVNG